MLMGKRQKKKRNKVYTGEGAALSRPVITRLSAADRSKVGQWWFEKKRLVKRTSIISAIVIFLSWLIFELIRIVS